MKRMIFFLLIGVAIVIFNMSGNDDCNIILFLSSPLLWFTASGYSPIHSSDIPMFFYYISVIIFWLFIGILAGKSYKIFISLKKDD